MAQQSTNPKRDMTLAEAREYLDHLHESYTKHEQYIRNFRETFNRNFPQSALPLPPHLGEEYERS